MLAIKSLKKIESSNLCFLFSFSVWVATKKIEKQCFNHSYSQKKFLHSNVLSKNLLSVRRMKGCVSSGEYYPRQGSSGFLSQNQGVL